MALVRQMFGWSVTTQFIGFGWDGMDILHSCVQFSNGCLHLNENMIQTNI